ncbi:unnamed protein product [Cyprideis torosa]|uniref:Uncharacterized protein n=1 Tax=Cyprideis torosa TaxID=163714 RepID=A0A7R8ZIJ4_9CRUS|nr:unnamed protein product [Cyprideis torosa]CAG0880102.1 unnamed protein product [Cyprideis torosa]
MHLHKVPPAHVELLAAEQAHVSTTINKANRSLFYALNQLLERQQQPAVTAVDHSVGSDRPSIRGAARLSVPFVHSPQFEDSGIHGAHVQLQETWSLHRSPIPSSAVSPSTSNPFVDPSQSLTGDPFICSFGLSAAAPSDAFFCSFGVSAAVPSNAFLCSFGVSAAVPSDAFLCSFGVSAAVPSDAFCCSFGVSAAVPSDAFLFSFGVSYQPLSHQTHSSAPLGYQPLSHQMHSSVPSGYQPLSHQTHSSAPLGYQPLSHQTHSSAPLGYRISRCPIRRIPLLLWGIVSAAVPSDAFLCSFRVSLYIPSPLLLLTSFDFSPFRLSTSFDFSPSSLPYSQGDWFPGPRIEALKIPQLKIDIMEFHGWWGRFASANHSQHGLSKVSKLQCLLEFTDGPAKAHLKNLPITDSAYDETRQLICFIDRRFGRRNPCLKQPFYLKLSLLRVDVSMSSNITSTASVASICDK